MKKPDAPTNEKERLFALDAYEILDTDPEEEFDGITELAAEILEVPVALVSLVDGTRQWFKSNRGLDISQTPREISFCGHVVASGAPLIVEDAQRDARFSDNPLVTDEPRVRFYAGVPLQTADGFTLGSLCAIDHEPKVPTAKQLRMMNLLAQQVVDQMDARRNRKALAAKHVAMMETSRRLAALFEGMVEGVVFRGPDGVIRAVNAAASRIFGLAPRALIGADSLSPQTTLSLRVVHPDGSAFPIEAWPSTLARSSGETVTNVLIGIYRPDDSFAWVRMTATPLREPADEAPFAVITTYYDVTALEAAKAIEDRLKRQERLVTTGTLAAGVGHEINNPLSFILANLDFALDELRAIAGGSPSARVTEVIGVLEDARDGGERVRKIVRGLRSMARGTDDAPVPTNLRRVVEMSINMAAHEIRAKATLDLRLTETPLVLTDEARLSQVFVNLLVNAAQAFPSGDVERNRIVVTSDVEPDGRIRVTVTDNGPGIPLDVQARIFDPFFTTKAVGEGTGLGLSISQSIVTALQGELHVTSRVGEGASFRVVLPPAPSAPIETPRVDKSPDAARTGGRVLVIDDEVGIGKAIARILGKEHDVVTCTDPREAIRLLVERDERFDVIFCDLTMPYLSGDRVHHAVKEHDAALADRMVFITGGVQRNALATFLDDVPNERVEKPFSPQNIRGIARRFVLSER